MTDAPGAVPAPPVATAVEVRPDGFPTLRGQHWGSGTARVVLLHAPGDDLDVWGPLPAVLAHHLGMAVDALDLPGHGLSDDPWEPERLPDFLAALLQPGEGDPVPALVAAGETGAVALRVAAACNPAALVLLSPVLPDGVEAWDRSPAVPKLFVAGALDGDTLERCRGAANRLGGWAVVVSVPTAERGPAILGGPWGGSVAEQVTGFVREALWRRGGGR